MDRGEYDDGDSDEAMQEEDLDADGYDSAPAAKHRRDDEDEDDVMSVDLGKKAKKQVTFAVESDLAPRGCEAEDGPKKKKKKKKRDKDDSRGESHDTDEPAKKKKKRDAADDDVDESSASGDKPKKKKKKKHRKRATDPSEALLETQRAVRQKEASRGCSGDLDDDDGCALSPLSPISSPKMCAPAPSHSCTSPSFRKFFFPPHSMRTPDGCFFWDTRRFEDECEDDEGFKRGRGKGAGVPVEESDAAELLPCEFPTSARIRKELYELSKEQHFEMNPDPRVKMWCFLCDARASENSELVQGFMDANERRGDKMLAIDTSGFYEEKIRKPHNSRNAAMRAKGMARTIPADLPEWSPYAVYQHIVFDPATPEVYLAREIKSRLQHMAFLSRKLYRKRADKHDTDAADIAEEDLEYDEKTQAAHDNSTKIFLALLKEQESMKKTANARASKAGGGGSGSSGGTTRGGGRGGGGDASSSFGASTQFTSEHSQEADSLRWFAQ
jgi:hypothetical protein